MRDSAAYLALDDHRIDQDPGVLQGDVIDQLHPAGFGIDLDLGDMASIGIGQRIGAPVHIGIEARRDVRREAIAGRAFEDARKLAQFDRKLRGTDHAYLATDQLEVMLGRFQHVAGELFGLLGHRARGEQNR